MEVLKRLLSDTNKAAYDFKNGLTETQDLYNNKLRTLRKAVDNYNSKAGYMKKVKLVKNQVLCLPSSKYTKDSVCTYLIDGDGVKNSLDMIYALVDELNQEYFKYGETSNTKDLQREIESMIEVFHTFNIAFVAFAFFNNRWNISVEYLNKNTEEDEYMDVNINQKCNCCGKEIKDDIDIRQDFWLYHETPAYTDASKYDGMICDLHLCNDCMEELFDTFNSDYIISPIRDNGLL